MCVLNANSQCKILTINVYKNIAFISGYSPAIIESVMHGDFLDPMQVMLATINSERYNKIRSK